MHAIKPGTATRWDELRSASLPGARQLIAEHIAEAMVSVDFARDLVSSVPADERGWLTDELQLLYDGMNGFLKRISN